ncbi:MetQ/NlpA family ABC transporter substrate-binding protein [Brevibacillus fulvus]|uniref:Lipoprotein n=1 Tax=Brevibacillus fulvus TaxID=1125967 RepID=A0A938XRD8_9BACL|nr:MetQ/NlpA family ABC transporter substrate-binding protein [Brevibacillus fulvus]MBM7588848.1 D-methionine transport system substrate-binding protein [Brevibacillus fulvus]
MKKLSLIAASVGLLAALALGGCGSQPQATGGEAAGASDSANAKVIRFGASAGPYSDMVKKAIAPILEKKGYQVELTEFGDYVQPNLALAEGSLDANLFQHEIYLKKFAADKNLQLSSVINVPTGPMGIYSKTFKSIAEITDGATIALPNDPANLARALGILEQNGLITIKEGTDPLTVSEKDIAENKKNLKITPVEAAQLPRALDGQDISVVPGNFALAAKMDLNSALALEEMPEHYLNLVAVKTADLDKPFVKDIKEAIESKEFEAVIDEQFKGFFKPEWMKNRK